MADPRRAVFVGDREWDDIHGAQQVGMRAILVPHSVLPEDQRGPVEGTPDAVVHRLIEVLDARRRLDSRARVASSTGAGSAARPSTLISRHQPNSPTSPKISHWTE